MEDLTHLITQYEYVKIILWLISGGFVAAFIALIVQIRTIKAKVKKENAEAAGADIDNHQKLDERYEKFVEMMKKEHQELRERDMELRERVERLEKEAIEKDRKMMQLMYSINKAHLCHAAHPLDKCPVLAEEAKFGRSIINNK